MFFDKLFYNFNNISTFRLKNFYMFVYLFLFFSYFYYFLTSYYFNVSNLNFFFRNIKDFSLCYPGNHFRGDVNIFLKKITFFCFVIFSIFLFVHLCRIVVYSDRIITKFDVFIKDSSDKLYSNNDNSISSGVRDSFHTCNDLVIVLTDGVFFEYFLLFYNVEDGCLYFLDRYGVMHDIKLFVLQKNHYLYNFDYFLESNDFFVIWKMFDSSYLYNLFFNKDLGNSSSYNSTMISFFSKILNKLELKSNSFVENVSFKFKNIKNIRTVGVLPQNEKNNFFKKRLLFFFYKFVSLFITSNGNQTLRSFVFRGIDNKFLFSLHFIPSVLEPLFSNLKVPFFYGYNNLIQLLFFKKLLNISSNKVGKEDTFELWKGKTVLDLSSKRSKKENTVSVVGNYSNFFYNKKKQYYSSKYVADLPKIINNSNYLLFSVNRSLSSFSLDFYMNDLKKKLFVSKLQILNFILQFGELNFFSGSDLKIKHLHNVENTLYKKKRFLNNFSKTFYMSDFLSLGEAKKIEKRDLYFYAYSNYQSLDYYKKEFNLSYSKINVVSAIELIVSFFALVPIFFWVLENNRLTLSSGTNVLQGLSYLQPFHGDVLSIINNDGAVHKINTFCNIMAYQWGWDYSFVLQMFGNVYVYSDVLSTPVPNINDFEIDSYLSNGELEIEKLNNSFDKNGMNYYFFYQISSENSIVLPVNSKVTTNLSSFDVIHSFALPSLGIKEDCVPGNNSKRIDVLSNTSGLFSGMCSELCGKDHARMAIRYKFIYPEFIFVSYFKF